MKLLIAAILLILLFMLAYYSTMWRVKRQIKKHLEAFAYASMPRPREELLKEWEAHENEWKERTLNRLRVFESQVIASPVVQSIAIEALEVAEQSLRDHPVGVPGGTKMMDSDSLTQYNSPLGPQSVHHQETERLDECGILMPATEEQKIRFPGIEKILRFHIVKNSRYEGENFGLLGFDGNLNIVVVMDRLVTTFFGPKEAVNGQVSDNKERVLV